MVQAEHYPGERLSLKGQTCTIRYVGTVADKSGEWLGVEWDDPNRGKHNGTHERTVYFTCRSKSQACASFLRPSQPWDTPRTFLQAIQQKYMPEFHQSNAEIIYFSGKQAEEVGFEKFNRRQAKLQGIHVLVLDHMQIQHRLPRPDDDGEGESIAKICADITELDLSSNLFETFDEIIDLCSRIPKLKALTLDGNRFSVDLEKTFPPLTNLHTLGLSQTLFEQAEVNKLVSDNGQAAFPSLRNLTLANNEFSTALNLHLPASLSNLDLADNGFSSLSDLEKFDVNNPTLNTLILKRNRISSVNAKADSGFCLPIRELDISYNAIDSFSFFGYITPKVFPELRHLRVTGNPLYKAVVSADGKFLSAEDGYMLTIARLPQLEYFNYSKITEKERLNAETYYLGQIAIEMGNAPEGEEDVQKVIMKHPRYRDLCAEYGEPNIQRRPKTNVVDPSSLAAKLVSVAFELAPGGSSNTMQQSWTEEIPKSMPLYTLLGLVGKRLGRMPLDLRLTLVTNDRDPIGMDGGYAGPEWWDSSDDEVDESNNEGDWVQREVEMVAGTRALGTFVEGNEARVRVNMEDKMC